jgi:hypothetical protein
VRRNNRRRTGKTLGRHTRIPTCLESGVKADLCGRESFSTHPANEENPLETVRPGVLAAFFLGGCAPQWSIPQITDPRRASAPGLDNSYCGMIEDMFEDRVNIQDRVSFDPSPVGRMANYYHNYTADQNWVNLYEKCMQGRGWSHPKP